MSHRSSGRHGVRKIGKLAADVASLRGREKSALVSPGDRGASRPAFGDLDVGRLEEFGGVVFQNGDVDARLVLQCVSVPTIEHARRQYELIMTLGVGVPVLPEERANAEEVDVLYAFADAEVALLQAVVDSFSEKVAELDRNVSEILSMLEKEERDGVGCS